MKKIMFLAAVVIVVLGVFVLKTIEKNRKDEIDKVFKTRKLLADTQFSLKIYYGQHKKKYPLELSLLVKGGYMKSEALKDVWGAPFVYQHILDKEKGENYLLASLGKDGKQFTEDDITAPKDKELHSFFKDKICNIEGQAKDGKK